MKQPCVYIISNSKRTVLYTGVTSDLLKRIWQHKQGVYEGFAAKYKCVDLMFYEQFEDMLGAISREKQIKAYRREKKDALIVALNPDWMDLYPSIV